MGANAGELFVEAKGDVLVVCHQFVAELDGGVRLRPGLAIQTFDCAPKFGGADLVREGFNKVAPFLPSFVVDLAGNFVVQLGKPGVRWIIAPDRVPSFDES